MSSGFKNPYNSNEPAIIRTGSGGDTVNGRLRLDETECSSGSSNKKIALWYKVHDEDPSPKLLKCHHGVVDLLIIFFRCFGLII